MYGKMWRNGAPSCKHEYTFNTIGKLQFKTCKECGQQFMRSADDEEWTIIYKGEVHD